MGVPRGNTQTVTVTGGRIFDANIVSATSTDIRGDSFCLGGRIVVKTEDSLGQLHTYIVELAGCVHQLRDGKADEQVGAYHEPRSNVAHILNG